MDNSIELKELRRLYNQRGEGLDTARERIAELEAKNAKLREALEDIRFKISKGWGTLIVDEIARAALAAVEER